MNDDLIIIYVLYSLPDRIIFFLKLMFRLENKKYEFCQISTK